MARKGFAVWSEATSVRKRDNNPSLCRAEVELELANLLRVVLVLSISVILVEIR